MKIDHSILRLVALFIAGMSVYLGYDLFVKGVTGEASLVLNASSLSGQLVNAAPGLFFVLSGVAITIVSLYRKIEEYRPMAKLVPRKQAVGKVNLENEPAPSNKVTVRRQEGDANKSKVFEIEIESDMEYLEIPAFLRRQKD